MDLELSLRQSSFLLNAIWHAQWQTAKPPGKTRRFCCLHRWLQSAYLSMGFLCCTKLSRYCEGVSCALHPESYNPHPRQKSHQRSVIAAPEPQSPRYTQGIAGLLRVKPGVSVAKCNDDGGMSNDVYPSSRITP